MSITLKKTTIEDLEILFEFQCDPEANQMAAFTSKDPTDKVAFVTKWTKVIKGNSIIYDSIWFKDILVGTICKYDMEGEPQISYWIGKDYWGKGFATKALAIFIDKVQQRPLFARTAFDNYGSQKVLENCGFKKTGEELFHAEARGREIIEFIFCCS